MLPSMPILFTRDSQDAFGNKIEPSTSLFGKNTFAIPITKPQPPAPPTPTPAPVAAAPNKKPEPKKQEPAIEKKPENTYETVLVSTYFNKVQSKFSNTRVPNNKFVQFKEILKNFNPYKEDPIVLYKRIEELFGEEHKDLAEEFLIFLTPGQALTIGRFMDHALLGQMTQFLECLHSTFARKPLMVRKVLRAVSGSLTAGGAAAMQAKVLPHLRSSPRLAALYRALFPDEPLPESAYAAQCEVLPASFLSEPRGPEGAALSPAEPRRRPARADLLDTVYLQGRVFLQHGRHLRPARVAFPYSKEPYRAHCKRLAPARAADPDLKRPPRKPRKAPPPATKDASAKRKAARKNKPRKREPKAEKADNKKEERKSWTRDEDKAMLEVLKGEAASAQVLDRIRARLPHRAPADIRARHAEVMALLYQMAGPQRA